jgi:hypothetical protein
MTPLGDLQRVVSISSLDVSGNSSAAQALPQRSISTDRR